MQGTVDQALSLAIYGNYAKAQAIPARYYPDHQVFTFCEYVRFSDLEEKDADAREIQFAADPITWFQKLIANGALGFRVIHVESDRPGFSDRMSIGLVGGGGRWLVEVLFRDRSDLWEGYWKVGNQDHPRKLIWQVRYVRVQRSRPRWPYQEGLHHRIDALRDILLEILEFARRHDLKPFDAAFERGLACLDTSIPLPANGRTYAPPGFLGRDAEHLLAACHDAWVFGAMGSWNDLGFEGDEQAVYEKLSDKLFWRMVHSAIAACNSTCAERK
jgi:hypothetical protein